VNNETQKNIPRYPRNLLVHHHLAHGGGVHGGLAGCGADLADLECGGAAISDPDDFAVEAVLVADAGVVATLVGNITTAVSGAGSDLHAVGAAVHAGGGQHLLSVAVVGGGDLDASFTMSNQVVDVEVSLAVSCGPDGVCALVEAVCLVSHACAGGTVCLHLDAVDVGGVLDMEHIVLVVVDGALLGGVQTNGAVAVELTDTTVLVREM